MMETSMSEDQLPVVLVIDDEPAIRLGLVAALRRHGYQVIAAEDGNDGLQKAHQQRPDLIVSDVMMPPPDGFELKRLMARDPELATVPFIFLTARTGVQDRIAGISDGADDYISKPFVMEELLARTDALLRRARTSEERGREQMKEIARQDMERLQKEILQNFHHELRTPLMNIAMPLELAVNHKFSDPAEQSKFIRMALSNVDKLDSLVADIVMLSNIEHGDLNSVRQSIDIKDHVLSPAYKRLERYKAKELDFSHEVVDQGVVKAPRREFSQAVLHLIDNAFKFSPQNGKVRLDIHTGAEGGVRIEVSDEGPGIPLEQRERVFERFYQVSQGDSREYDGLGVGLTIARAVFQGLKGDITIIETDAGNRVRAVLPGVSAEDIVYG
jgi:two-component system, sensor histidine kinase and response regulator